MDPNLNNPSSPTGADKIPSARPAFQSRRDFVDRDGEFNRGGLGRTQSAFPENDRSRADRDTEWNKDKGENKGSPSFLGGRDRSDFEPPRRVFSEDARSGFQGIRRTGSGTGGRPIRKEVSQIREQGVICSVKDQFGFIKCAERDDEIFFHFSELPRESPIDVGIEVEFSVATDTRNNKLSAVSLHELPKGTVKLEDIESDIKTGFIVKEVRDEGEFGAGEIETTNPDGSKDIMKFSTRNLAEPKVSLRVGDEVKFNVVVNRRSKTRSATAVVIYRFGGQRETGVIHSLKDTFGFIDCCETPTSLFFHFRDVCLLQADQQELFVGMEVEFTHGLDKTKKPIATRIRALPKGTVQFETILPEKVRGMVTRQLVNMGARPHPEEMGLIKLTSDEDTYTVPSNFAAAMKSITPASSQNASFPSLQTPSLSGYSTSIGDPRLEKLARHPSITSSPSQGYDINIFPFTAKDLENIKQNPKEGDEVEFNVVIKKRQQRKRATNVSVMKEAPEAVEHGVIASVHKSYGHIVCLEREEDMFFHFTDVFDNQPEMRAEDIQVGMELEFRVIIDPRNHKKKAVNIKILPRGSVQSESVLDGRIRGVVFRECRPGQGQNTFGLRRRDESGLIDYDDPSQPNSPKETLPFITADLSNEHQRERVQLWPGDEVEFSVAIGKKTGARYATQIKRIKNRELPREKGTVSSIKNYFGFLSSPDRDEEVYFHFSELEPFMDKKEIEKVRVGAEFEYSVARDSWADNKPIAVGLKALPKGTVKQDEIEDLRYYGVVETDVRSRGPNDNFGGNVVFIGADQTAETIKFDLDDVDKKFSLRNGDRVEFSIAKSAVTNERRATNVVLMKETGVVGPVRSGYGCIIAEDKTQVPFSDKEAGVVLQEGDVVEFLRVFNARSKDYLAVDIRRLKEGDRSASSTSSSDVNPRKFSSKVDNTGKVFVLRNPKVADSGPAFGIGRGRLMNEERNKLTQDRLFSNVTPTSSFNSLMASGSREASY